MKGITVTLYVKTKTGEDNFGAPVYTETPTDVEDVLVAPGDTIELLSSQDLHGERADYVLGIPKGDTHDWNDCRVEFFGQTFHTFGSPLKGIDELIPLRWNTKVKVKRIE